MVYHETGAWLKRVGARRLLPLFLSAFFILPLLSGAAETNWSTVITEAKPAVVRIVVETLEGTVSGSGVLISEDGLILTAAHVIEGASQITVVVQETQEYQGTVVQEDSEADVAVLRISVSGLKYLTLGDSATVSYYEEICVLGYPRPTIGVGFIPARGSFIGLRASSSATYLQFEANPLDHGHSGGPVIDATGHVVGIVVSVVADQELGVFNKLAVATNTLQEILARPALPAQRTLRGHAASWLAGVTSVGFSPDGKLLASGSMDKTVRLWDVSTGRELRTLVHTDGVWSVAFSPGGTLLASGSSDDTVKLWGVASGLQLRTFSGHANNVMSVAFSPDGKLLASGSWDGTIKLWDVATGQVLRTLTGHTDMVMSVAFSPDGKTLVSGSPDDTVKLWDVTTGTVVRTFSGHTNNVLSVAFSPDGALLASGSVDKTVRLWDVSTGRELRTLVHADGVWSVSFSPDGKILASGSWDGTIKLWDVATGQVLRTLTGHTDMVMSVAFSPDGTLLASGSDDDTVKLWAVPQGD